MKHLITYILLILVSNTILANPNTVIQLQAKYNRLTGELVTPDKILLQKGLKNFEKGQYRLFLRDMKKASAFGNSIAQKYVGLSYINEWGVEKDWAKAYAWIKLAALDGTQKNKKLEIAVLEELLPNEVKEAEKTYLEISKDYGTLVTKERRKRWQQKQKKSFIGSRVGAQTSRVKQGKMDNTVVYSSDLIHAQDQLLNFVVNYNFGLAGPNGGTVTTGEILPVED